MLENFSVAPGQLIAPAFERLAAAVQSLQLRPGPNVHLSAPTPFGRTITVAGYSGDFDHPFRPTLNGFEVKFTLGYILTYEPTINDSPISGNTANNIPAPALTLDPQFIDSATQESLIVVEITPLDADDISAGASVIITQAKSIPPTRARSNGDGKPETGIQALAKVVWADRTPQAVHAIVMHNLTYNFTAVSQTASNSPRHFFSAV